MSEAKIARFVGLEACKSIFSENSTFVLRSPEHYRRLYETTEGGNAKGDRDEGCADTVDGGTAEFTGFVDSCWTMLKGSEPTRNEWDIFKENEQNIVAIVSTPSKVCEFLNKAIETDTERTKRRFPFWSVRQSQYETCCFTLETSKSKLQRRCFNLDMECFKPYSERIKHRKQKRLLHPARREFAIKKCN